MLVFLIISLTTINFVNAQSYQADDTTIISSNYIDMFQNYFGEDTSYKYFTYKCTYGSNERNCYYAIDDDFNYIRVVYLFNGTYNYTTKIETGIDEDFSVSGLCFEVHESYSFIVCVGLAFVLALFIVRLLLDF